MKGPYWDEIVGSHWPGVSPAAWRALATKARDGAKALNVEDAPQALNGFHNAVPFSARLQTAKDAMTEIAVTPQSFADALILACTVCEAFAELVDKTRNQILDISEQAHKDIQDGKAKSTVLDTAQSDVADVAAAALRAVHPQGFPELAQLAQLLGARNPWLSTTPKKEGAGGGGDANWPKSDGSLPDSWNPFHDTVPPPAGPGDWLRSPFLKNAADAAAKGLGAAAAVKPPPTVDHAPPPTTSAPPTTANPAAPQQDSTTSAPVTAAPQTAAPPAADQSVPVNSTAPLPDGAPAISEPTPTPTPTPTSTSTSTAPPSAVPEATDTPASEPPDTAAALRAEPSMTPLDVPRLPDPRPDPAPSEAVPVAVNSTPASAAPPAGVTASAPAPAGPAPMAAASLGTAAPAPLSLAPPAVSAPATSPPPAAVIAPTTSSPLPRTAAVAAQAQTAADPTDMDLAVGLLAKILAATPHVRHLSWAVAVARTPTGTVFFVTSNEPGGWVPAGLYLPHGVLTPLPPESGLDPARTVVDFAEAAQAELTAVASALPIDTHLVMRLRGVPMMGSVAPAVESDLARPRPDLVDRLTLTGRTDLLEQVDAVPDGDLRAACLDFAVQAQVHTPRGDPAAGPLRELVLLAVRHHRSVPDTWWAELRALDNTMAEAVAVLRETADAPGSEVAQLIRERRCNELVLLLSGEPSRQRLRDAAYVQAQLLSAL